MKPTQVASHLTSLTIAVYKFLGWNPLNENLSTWTWFYFASSMFYVGVCLLQEFVYFVVNVESGISILKLTDLAPCMGFTTLSCVKMFIIWKRRRIVKRIFDKLQSFCFLKLRDNQFKIVLASKMLMKILTVKFFVLIWIFNLAPVLVTIFQFLEDGSYRKQMPTVISQLLLRKKNPIRSS